MTNTNTRNINKKNDKYFYWMLLLILLMSSSMLQAQKNISVKETSAGMSLGQRNGFAVMIENGSRKEAENVLDDFLTQYAKKPETDKVTKNELKVNDIIIPSISQQPIDLYFLFDENKTGIEVIGFFDMGTSFLSAQVFPDQYKSGMMFMERYGLRIEKVRVEAEVKEATEQMEKLQREKSDLEKEKARLEKSISDCEATINEAKSNLSSNSENTRSKETQIKEQEEKMSTLSKKLDQYKDN
jgi:valyl-tRNA synthetase